MGKEGRSLPVHRDGKFCYEIRLEQDFERLPECVEALGVRGRRLCIVTDSHVAPIFLEKAESELKKTGWEIYSYVLPAGEEKFPKGLLSGLFKTLLKILERVNFHHIFLEILPRSQSLVPKFGPVIVNSRKRIA